MFNVLLSLALYHCQKAVSIASNKGLLVLLYALVIMVARSTSFIVDIMYSKFVIVFTSLSLYLLYHITGKNAIGKMHKNRMKNSQKFYILHKAARCRRRRAARILIFDKEKPPYNRAVAYFQMISPS